MACAWAGARTGIRSGELAPGGGDVIGDRRGGGGRSGGVLGALMRGGTGIRELGGPGRGRRKGLHLWTVGCGRRRRGLWARSCWFS